MKKNILFILPWLPYPMKSGGHQAIYNGIKAVCNDANIFITYIIEHKAHSNSLVKKFISTLNNDIKVEPYIVQEEKISLIRKIIRYIHIFVLNVMQFFLCKIKKGNASTNINYKNYFELFYPKFDSYTNHIEELIEKHKIDIVQCEMLGNCSIVLNLPQKIKKLFVHHEIGFIRNEQEIQSANITSKSSKGFLELSKIQEVGLLNRYDAIITLSERDKLILEDAGTTTQIFPSIATVDNKYTFLKESHNFNVLSFVGPEFHTPNKIGIMWFLENCWEIIKKNDSSYKLKIIGNWSEKTKNDICNKYRDIYFSGYVNDLAEELRNTIMIVPITIGSGIRMKILEAATIGVPIVTTKIGVSGIGMQNEVHCCIGDSPREFIDLILKNKNQELRLQLIENAYDFVNKNYSLVALRKNRLNIYEKIS